VDLECAVDAGADVGRGSVEQCGGAFLKLMLILILGGGVELLFLTSTSRFLRG